MKIYLDNNATTFLDPEVLTAMKGVWTAPIGNPSSIHRYGQAARALLSQTTKEIAAYFGVLSSEIVFTSGATEALNMVIRSAPKGTHIIASSLEHISVIESLKHIDCEVTYLDPEPGKGAITVDQIAAAVEPNTSMLVVMAANNETGVKTDLEPIAAFAQERGLLLVVDGVAILGKEPWSLPQGVSAACFSGHKIHGPTGVGLAIIRKPMKCSPLICGGPQQHAMRGGTENLAAIVGFAKALTLPFKTFEIATLRDHLEQEILRLPDVLIHGADQPRICNTSNITFRGMDGETLLMQLDLAGVAVSHGSACSSGSLESSRVLLNMGVSPKDARSSIRFSLCRFTTLEQIDHAIEVIEHLTKNFRDRPKSFPHQNFSSNS